MLTSDELNNKIMHEIRWIIPASEIKQKKAAQLPCVFDSGLYIGIQQSWCFLTSHRDWHKKMTDLESAHIAWYVIDGIRNQLTFLTHFEQNTSNSQSTLPIVRNNYRILIFMTDQNSFFDVTNYCKRKTMTISRSHVSNALTNLLHAAAEYREDLSTYVPVRFRQTLPKELTLTL